MKIYTCWITCLLESYQDIIFISLIKKGYTIGLASQNNVNRPGQVSAVLAFTLFKMDDNKLTLAQMVSEINSIMTDAQMYFYSIIVSENYNANWTGSNIVVQNNKTAPLLPPAPNKKSKLN